ncbi:MAG TPA: hypothetical protein VE912_11605 [Bacteroidales bacterium]|nr:hypothetical protein [Bacteroidales bacterium]
MAKRKNDMKGISRVDSKGTHGWYVRVYKNGKTYSKLYSDNKYGGKERALKIAKKARKMAEQAMKSIPTKRTRRLVKSDRRNKTGVIGVNRTKKRNRSGTVSEYYQVTWSPKPGTTKNKQWSINKYGEDKAFQLACDFRHQVMRNIHGERYDEEMNISTENSPAKGDNN